MALKYKGVNPKKEAIFKQVRDFFSSPQGEEFIPHEGYFRIDSVMSAMGIPIGHGEKILTSKALRAHGFEKIFVKPTGYFYRRELA